MSYEEYRAKRRQDPEYRKVERRLKLRLDIADALFAVEMWLRSVKAFCDDFCWAMMLSHPTEIDVPLGREEAKDENR